MARWELVGWRKGVALKTRSVAAECEVGLDLHSDWQLFLFFPLLLVFEKLVMRLSELSHLLQGQRYLLGVRHFVSFLLTFLHQREILVICSTPLKVRLRASQIVLS